MANLSNGQRQFWQDKVADSSKIKVPAFVVAVIQHLTHHGAFPAWCELGSKDKWTVHDRQEWPYYYDEANIEELRRFLTITYWVRTTTG